MNTKESKFSLEIKKNNPKPNAPQYDIKTIKELFEILTEENYKRFLKAFKESIEIKLELNKVIESMSKGKGQINIDVLKIESFTWIDD
jgi:hypothetical protein